jgi:hypothetical protein
VVTKFDPEGHFLEQIIGNKNIRSLKTGVSAWKIEAGLFSFFAQTEYEIRKQRLLEEIISTFPNLIVSFDENPIEDGLKGNWRRAGDLQKSMDWFIPSDVDVSEFKRWTYVGGWALYVSSEAVNFPGSNRLDTIMSFLKTHDIPLKLVAYYDNDPWFLYLNV